MTKTIFYEKKGRKYVPVLEHDDRLFNSFPNGTHIVHCYPNGQSRVYDIDPAYAPMIAAGMVAKNAVMHVVRDAPHNKKLTKKQFVAWKALEQTFEGNDRYLIEWPSVDEIVNSCTKALADEATLLLTNTAVKDAYAKFLMVCALTKEEK